MLISLRVESNFTAPAKGYLKISIDDSLPVQAIIDKFCDAKGIVVDPNYQLITRSNYPLSGVRLIEYYKLREGEVLILGNSDEFKPFRFTNWYAISALAFFLGIAGIAICVSVYLLIRNVPESYAIVFDAGSTHTDTILFKWPGSKINNTGIVTEVHGCYTKGGIASIPPDGKNISNYIGKCLEETRGYIHPDSSHYTEVFFGATAGMRLLQETNPIKANQTMDAVTDFLHSSGLEFDDTQAQIISGFSEGVTGWITVNYLNRHLQSQKREVTRGALDLGGASTQITFEVDESTLHGHPHVQKVQLYGRQYNVFCQSFLCYGTVQALYRYRVTLLKEHLNSNNPSRMITSPCDPIGLETEVPVSKIISSPCTPNSISILHHLSGRELSETIVFVGSSDLQECQSRMDYLLSTELCKDLDVDADKCIDPTLIPDGYWDKTFAGFSGFAYARENLNLSKGATKDEFLARTHYHCNLTLQEIIHSVANDKSKELKNQKELCFKAIFVHTLLSKVYKFDSNSRWGKIEFQNDVENKTLGWALGYMVNATESISTVPSIPTFDTIAFTMLLIIFCIFILLGAAFFFRALRFRKPNWHNQNSRRPVLSNC